MRAQPECWLSIRSLNGFIELVCDSPFLSVTARRSRDRAMRFILRSIRGSSHTDERVHSFGSLQNRGGGAAPRLENGRFLTLRKMKAVSVSAYPLTIHDQSGEIRILKNAAATIRK